LNTVFVKKTKKTLKKFFYHRDTEISEI